MKYEFRLPDLGEGVTEAEIASVRVRAGQAVAEDEPIAEVETDKANVEIPCPVDGVVALVHVSEGDIVQVGELMVTFDVAGGEAQPPPAAAPGPPPVASPTLPTGSGQRATPGARQLAQRHGLNLATVVGAGPAGAISEADVMAAVQARDGASVDAVAGGGRRVPLRGVRRRIAERLTESHREIPKVTVVEECDFTDLMACRGRLSFVPFVLKAAVTGLAEFPILNVHVDGDDIVYHDRFDIGVAAQGPSGLVVPVVRAVDTKSLEELNAEVARLAGRAREEELTAEEMRGGTFTVTLAGKLGGFFAIPLVNPGEAAILGVHRVAARPVVIDGEIAVRQVGLVSCSFDHRVADGTTATEFLLRVIRELEHPDGIV